ncbi:MAG: hypothetical protein D6767_00460, partial [Candidatus Hydrogenedentota bacterium]
VQVMPIVLAGFYAGSIEGNYTQSYFMPAFSAGSLVDYFLTKKITVSLNFTFNYMYSRESLFFFTDILLGAGYRF